MNFGHVARMGDERGDRDVWRAYVRTAKKIYKTVILPAILYGCETWTLTLREEKRLRVFENKELKMNVF
ncbi:hypothetical protein C0J52_15258 [Blattella germanica]|nr:hypothetical protein C0J52_15258 [Blattella germanica]